MPYDPWHPPESVAELYKLYPGYLRSKIHDVLNQGGFMTDDSYETTMEQKVLMRLMEVHHIFDFRIPPGGSTANRQTSWDLTMKELVDIEIRWLISNWNPTRYERGLRF